MGGEAPDEPEERCKGEGQGEEADNGYPAL